MLDASRNAEAENASGLAAVQPQVFRLHTAAIRQSHHVYEDQHSRKILRDNARQRDAVSGHFADDNKKQVQDHIQHTRRRQINKRTLRVAAGAENRVAKVEDPKRGHTKRVDAEIEHRAGQKVFLRL